MERSPRGRLEDRLEDLGARYEVRLSDLREWHVVRIKCNHCNRIGSLYPKSLKRRYPGHQRLLDLERKLRCNRCGNINGNTWKIYRISRD